MSGKMDARRKTIYAKPLIRHEKLFEVSALACGKCTVGPFPQYACQGRYQTS